MNKKKRLLGSLTRRSFVKSAAMGAAVAGCASGATFALGQEAEGAAAEEVFSSYCRGYCTNNCPLDIHVVNGDIAYATAHVSDDERFTRICVKGHALPYREYSKKRILHPMKRTGERGEGKWEEISWEEALDTVAGQWKSITEQYGPTAMSFYRLTGNRSILNGDGKGNMYSRFCKATGCTTYGVAVDAATSYALGRQVGLGYYLAANSPTDYINSKTIIIWGANPAVSQLQNMHFLQEAKDNGTKIICIDPVFTATAAYADEYIPIIPGSDGVLAFGLMSLAVQNGWVDMDFLANHSVAPFLVKETDGKFLRLSDLGRAEAGAQDDAIVVMAADGSFDIPENIAEPVMEGTFDVEGVSVTTAWSLLLARIAEYPMDRVVELTGIPEETIINLATDYAGEGNKPSAIYTFFGVDHYYNAHWSAACMGALAIITGNIGKKGAWIGVGEFRNPTCFNTGWASDVPVPEGGGKNVIVAKMAEVMNEKTYNGNPFEIHGIYCACGNPVGNVANRNNTIDWLLKMDFIVVADVVMSETAEYADIVLPAAFWFECEDIMGSSANSPFVNYGEKILEPAGEAKPDFEIYKLLAERLGYGEYFQYSTSEYLTHILDTDECRSYGIDYETLKEKKVMLCEPLDYVHGEGGVFPTNTKRAEFYLENPKASNDDSRIWDVEKERLPYWEPPREVFNGMESKYPFQLITEHNKLVTHTQWFDVEAIQELDPEPLISITAVDAESLGIADGDVVRVYNDRGSLTIKCVIKNNMMPGIVMVPKGYTAAQYIDGHLSNLTPNEMNPFCGNQPFFDCAVAIEKM